MSDYGGSTYQGLGAFGDDDEPGGGKNRTGVIIAVVALLLVLGGGATAFFLTRGEEPEQRSDKPPPTTSTTASSAPPATGTTTTTTTTTTTGSNKVEPSVDGWQGVVSTKEGVAYDVPEDWQVESPDFVSGFEDSSGPRVLAHDMATYKPEACSDVDGSIRGRAGFYTPSSGGGDLATVAEDAAVAWVDAAVGTGKAKPLPARSVDLDGGELTAQVVSAMAAQPDGECSAPDLRVTAAAFEPSGGDPVVFVVYTDQGVDDALHEDIENRIIGSLRPHGDGGGS